MAASKLNIYQRVNAIIADGKSVPKLGKMQGSSGNYNFVQTDDVLSHLRPYFAKHGIDFSYSAVEHTCDTETIKSTYNGQEKLRTERRTMKGVECVLTNIDNPEEKIKGVEYGYGIDGQDKGPGKATSYAVKTWLINKFLLRGNPDEDKLETYVQAISPEQQQRLRELLASTKTKEDVFLKFAGIKSLSDLQFVSEAKYATLERMLLAKAKGSNGSGAKS